MFASIGLRDEGFSKGLDGAKGAMGKMADFAGTAMKAVTTAVVAAGTAVYALGAASAKIGMEFEHEMTNLTAITGMSADEMDKVSKGIRGIATDTGMSVIELAKNAKMVAEAGGDVDLMMAQMTHGANLALASQTDLATTLDFLGSSMKTFGIEAEDTQGVVDSFAAVTTLANLELSQLAESFVNVGGSASSAGLGIDDVNSFLITFSNAGLKGGAAGTALNAVIRNLSTPTKKAAEELEALGISLYDAEGKSRDMYEIMYDLEGALSDMTDAQANQTQSIIFDSVALKGWNMIMDEGVEIIKETAVDLGKMSDAFDGAGQTAGMAGVLTGDLKGNLDKLKAGVTDLGLSLYEDLDSPLGEVVGKAQGYVAELSQAFAEGGLEGAVKKIGSIVADAITYIAEQLPTFIQTGINVIAALVTGLLQNADTILDAAMTAFNTLLDGIVSLLPALIPLAIKVLMTLATGLIGAIDKLIPAAIEIITSLITGISQRLPELIPLAQKAIMNIVESLAKNLPLILQSAIDIVVTLALGIADMLPTLIPVAIDAILTLVMTLLDNIDLLIDAAIALVSGLAEGIINALPILLEKAPIIITKLVTALVDNIPKLLEAALGIIMMIWKGIFDNLPEIGKAAGEIVATIFKAIMDFWPKILDTGKNIAKGFWEGISSMGTWLKDKVTGFFSGILDGVKNVFKQSSPSKAFADISKNNALGFIGGLEAMKDAVDDAMGDVFNLDALDDMKLPSFNTSGFGANFSTGMHAAENWGSGGNAGGGVTIIQYIDSVPQSPTELAAMAKVYFDRARWVTP